MKEINWAKRILEIRTSLKMTQMQFAEYIHVNFTTINRWEKGHTAPIPLAQFTLNLLWKQTHNGKEKADSHTTRVHKTADHVRDTKRPESRSKHA